jgi:hypothetical protein
MLGITTGSVKQHLFRAVRFRRAMETTQACLGDRRLLDSISATAPTPTPLRERLRACAAQATLACDLARIDVLGAVPPAGRQPRRGAGRRRGGARLAVASGATARGHSATTTPHLALADELASAVATTVSVDDGGASPSAATARSTCTWGDPLLGVGCDEPAVMQIAWR